MSNEWNPQQYAKFADERTQPFNDLLAMLQPQQRGQIVDLGCGTGDLTQKLHKQMGAKTTLGIDSSDEMLKKTADLTRGGLSFTKADIDTWAPTHTFDVVFSNAALQWCPNHEELFAKLKGVLRAEGQLAVQMPMSHDMPTHVIAAQMSTEEPWASRLKGWKYEQKQQMLTPEEYSRLLFRLGFKEQQVVMRIYGHTLESREGVIEWVKGSLLTSFKGRLSDDHYQEFLGELRKRLFAQLPDDKPFFFPYKRILIWGRL